MNRRDFLKPTVSEAPEISNEQDRVITRRIILRWSLDDCGERGHYLTPKDVDALVDRLCSSKTTHT